LLGLYELREGSTALTWDLMFYAVMALLPTLSGVLIWRIFAKKSVSALEVMIALSAWGLFLYNASFVRG